VNILAAIRSYTLHLPVSISKLSVLNSRAGGALNTRPDASAAHSSLKSTRESPPFADPQPSLGIYKSNITRRETTGYRGMELATDLISTLFRGYRDAVAVRLWRGDTFFVGGPPAASRAPFVLVFRHPDAVCALILGRDPLRLVEAYFRSDLDIEGDLFAALELKNHLESLPIPIRDRLTAVCTAFRLRALNPRETDLFGENVPSQSRPVRAHSREDNRNAVRFHYDVSNDFYQLWLGRSMVYSCGYFQTPDDSIDDAQFAKLDHICRKLLLRPNEKFLDIGCGWGTLLIHAASEYGVQAHGVTLSRQQLAVAQRRIAESGLEGQVTVELKDYRDLSGESFDKVASVGMFEHVGLKNLPLYFTTVNRVLKPGGLFLNHGITHEQAGWQKNLSTRFINRYVFPDGELDSVSNIQRGMEEAHFEIEDVESLRAHYALTLRSWVSQLERRHEQALEYVNEATYRVWRLYMSAAAMEFESGNVGIYQVLASKRGVAERRLPLTRHHLYTGAQT
jgi:cyclopropane-fatty-acyl-phospholipid synthase